MEGAGRRNTSVRHCTLLFAFIHTFLAGENLTLKAKSKLIGTQLEIHYSAINYRAVSKKLRQNVILIRLFFRRYLRKTVVMDSTEV